MPLCCLVCRHRKSASVPMARVGRVCSVCVRRKPVHTNHRIPAASNMVGGWSVRNEERNPKGERPCKVKPEVCRYHSTTISQAVSIEVGQFAIFGTSRLRNIPGTRAVPEHVLYYEWCNVIRRTKSGPRRMARYDGIATESTTASRQFHGLDLACGPLCSPIKYELVDHRVIKGHYPTSQMNEEDKGKMNVGFAPDFLRYARPFLRDLRGGVWTTP